MNIYTILVYRTYVNAVRGSAVIFRVSAAPLEGGHGIRMLHVHAGRDMYMHVTRASTAYPSRMQLLTYHVWVA